MKSHALVEAEGFVLRSNDGKTRARLGLNPNGSVFFTLHDTDEIPRTELSVSAEGSSLLIQAAANRKARVVSRVDPDGRAGIMLYDDAGKIVWSTP
jgi:hypothetical protein